MKIGVVTCFNRQNVTECLGLWALQKTLHKRKCYVKILNIQDNSLNEEPIRMDYSLEQFNEMFPDYIKITNVKQAKEQFDNITSCILTGDHVWNSGKLKLAGKALLLNGATNRIAFGAGMQNRKHTLFEKFIWKRALKKFSVISVHSTAEKNYLEKKIRKQVEIICENSFLLRKKEYNEMKKECKIEEDFILFEQIDPENSLLYKIAEQTSDEIKIPVYSLSGGEGISNLIKANWSEEPGEFLGGMEKAKYVITDHYGTLLFALIYKRPFLFVDAQGKNPKAKELLGRLKLLNHYVQNIDQYTGLDHYKILNVHTLHKKLAKEKVNAYKLLDEITGVCNRDNEMVDAPTGILKKDCCGCYACEAVCPKDAIRMKPDITGHFYPVVKKEACINCLLCKKICIIQEPKRVEYMETYPQVMAVYNRNIETRLSSSSGGVFPEMAKYIIENKQGFVAGVRYDEDMNAISDIADNMEDVKKFYGSKYVKSQLTGVYRKIKELLGEGKAVLFSGLPCECSALRAFLKKDYDNLYICEIMCHAVPSAKVFEKYLHYLEDKFKKKVTNVIFRQKKKGWLPHQTSMVIEFNGRKPLRVVNRTNNYYRIFANDVIARKSCSNCRFTYLNRAGDLTVGDFWGVQNIHPEMYDNQGTSFILINNRQGMKLWEQIRDNFKWMNSTVEDVFKKNHSEPIDYCVDEREFFSRMEQEPIDPLLEEFNDLKN